jgi:flagellar motor switch protein FliG
MSETARAMTGTQKAALVVMQLSQERAAVIMRQFTETEAEEITAEIVRLRRVDPATAEAAIAEFHERTMSGRTQARGGRDFAAGLLEASFGAEKAAGFLDRLTSSMAGRAFDFLDTAEAAQVSMLLDGELPDTVALVLAHLRPDQASAVLSRFDTAARADIAQCIATMGSATPEAVAIAAETLKHRARAVVVPKESFEVKGGVQPLVDIINRADVATERDLMAELEERDPVLAEEVRARMLNFADIVRLEDRDVQQVLRGIDAAVLAIAMKGAAEPVIDIIRRNMSERNRELLDDEISNLGQVRKTQVEEARAEIVRSIRALEADGTITIQRGEDEELVD